MAQEISEFRIGTLLGENAQDRLSKQEYLRQSTQAPKPGCSRLPTIPA